MLGFMLQIMSLINIGIILFSIVVLFQIITLPDFVISPNSVFESLFTVLLAAPAALMAAEVR